MATTPKLIAVFLIIVGSQANFISCDDQTPSFDGIAKAVADDVAVKVDAGLEYLAKNIISVAGDATIEIKEDLRLDAKLNKAGKIIERIKGGFEKMTIEHNARLQVIIEKIKSDTAASGGAENPFLKALINMVTVFEDDVHKLVLIVCDYLVDQVKLIAEDLEHHINGKVIADKLRDGQIKFNDIKLKGVIDANLDLLDKYHVVRGDIDNEVVSKHTLEYMDEKIRGIIFTFFDRYINVRGHIANDIETLEGLVFHIFGHH